MEAPSWDSLDDYIRRGIPAVLPLPSVRRASIVVGTSAAFLAIRIPNVDAEETPLVHMKELSIERREIEGEGYIEARTSDRTLFLGFYSFAIALAEILENTDVSISAAIGVALDSFGKLLDQKTAMSYESQIGLIGELCFFRAVLLGMGTQAASSWLGPLQETHDFRFGSVEIEVKTTIQKARIHKVHGLEQLEPSAGSKLYLLSLQFERAGAGGGLPLPERIKSVRQLLQKNLESSRTFENYLSRAGYADRDAALYRDSYKLRTKPALVAIEDPFPKMSKPMLFKLLSAEALNRIRDVAYSVDVDGLGVLADTKEFKRVLPAVSQFD